MGCCPVFKAVFYLALVYLAFIFFVPYPQLKINPQSFKRAPAPQFLGPLTRNNILESAERLLENKIKNGPESIEVKDGVVYTGTIGGDIVRITGDKMETIASTGPKNCVPFGLPSNPKACGHPLGLRFNNEGDLIIADCVKGVLKLNTKTGKLTTIIAGDAVIDGVASNFIDDVTIAKNGDMFISDADSKWSFTTVFGSLIEVTPNARILHYDAKTQKVKTLLDNLYFANGVQLSPNEDYLLFSQTTRSQIMKYNLKGAKAGQLEIFVDNLPGIPDNIRPSGRGTYWVALYGTRLPDKPSLHERCSKCAFTTKVVFSSLIFLHKVTDFLHSTLGLPLTQTINEEMEKCLSATVTNQSYGLVVEVNENGEIIRSLHSPKGRLNKISQVTEYQGNLYIGSPHNPFIGKVSLATEKKAKA